MSSAGFIWLLLVALVTVTSAVSPPGPVSNFSIKTGNSTEPDVIAQVDLAWSAPVSGGAATSYVVYVDGELTYITTETRAYIVMLTVGQRYNFSVTAANVAGESSPVAASAVAQLRPSSPLAVQAVPGDGVIDVSWLPPTNNGGYGAILRYLF